jgi:hypothetical protein
MLTLYRKIVFEVRKVLSNSAQQKITEVAKIAILGGKEGLHQHYIDTPEAGAAEKMANAVGTLAEKLEPVDQAVIIAGPLIFVKVKVEGKTIVAVETMSQQIRLALSNNPRLLNNPQLFFSELQQIHNGSVETKKIELASSTTTCRTMSEPSTEASGSQVGLLNDPR